MIEILDWTATSTANAKLAKVGGPCGSAFNRKHQILA